MTLYAVHLIFCPLTLIISATLSQIGGVMAVGLLESLAALLMRIGLWFRYRVTVRGLELLDKKYLNKPGGMIFLPNHPSYFIDPVVVPLAVRSYCKPRPVVVEYMFYKRLLHWFMYLVRALPIPDLSHGGNSFKRKRIEKAVQRVIDRVKAGESIFVYPAGRVKDTPREWIGGASAVHTILQGTPEANVVLVRVLGLWGSLFSKAQTGKAPHFKQAAWFVVKTLFKNLIFFCPRREIIVELALPPADFPYQASRLEFNRYLENWYNRPDGLADNPPGYQGESLKLVSYSCWKEELPEVTSPSVKGTMQDAESLDVAEVPPTIRQQIINEVARLADRDPKTITPQLHLATDLGFDSLDIASLIAFLNAQWGVTDIGTEELTTVGKAMAAAAGQFQLSREREEDKGKVSRWMKDRPQGLADMPEGATLHEVFLRNCDRFASRVACADIASGVLTYRQLKTRVLLLAEYLRKLPGPYVGILLPSSCAVQVLILAAQIAGKAPVMINWTMGSRHFENIVQLTGLRAVLSSWRFIDRLDNIEFDGLDDLIVLVEDLTVQLTLKDRLQALRRSYWSADKIVREFQLEGVKGSDTAVLLFTSGTENLPKGVPLSHDNILHNQRAILEAVKIERDERFLSFLPPFHSFGFTITGLLPLLAGMPVYYASDPNDSAFLAATIAKWHITLLCGAPTFLRGILRRGTREQLQSLRLVVSGAEPAPHDFADEVARIGPRTEFIEGYGITECSPVVTLNPPGTPHRGVGIPAPGVELCIVHPETLEPLPVGEQGLILVAGPNVFAGYLGNVGRSPFVTAVGKKWYHTGDLGSLHPDGSLSISGRQKRFIKIGGEMVSLAAIESALEEIAVKRQWLTKTDVPSVVACAQEVAGEKPRIALFTTFDIDVSTANAALRESGFSNLVRIHAVVKVEEIPLMGSGKPHYRQLVEEHASHLVSHP